MPTTKGFTETGVARLKPPPKPEQVDHFEHLQDGRSLVLRLSYGGAKTWRVLFYSAGKPKTKALGRYPGMGVKDARKAAREFDAEGELRKRAAGSFKEVAENYVRWHVDENKLRSKREIERHLRSYIYPKWEGRRFLEIRRGEVNALLDHIAEYHGRSQADAVLATIRGIMNWYQSRDEDYVSPVVAKMRRDKRRPNERGRKRILNDDEIRAVWTASDEVGTFGAFIKVALLTAQRREKVVTMQWADLVDGEWRIRSQPGEKSNAGALRLPQLVLNIISAQNEVNGNPFVFPGKGRGPFNSFSQRKAELDAKLPPDMPHWVLHDLRRTARSLMPRAGIRPDISERVLGHAIAGVEGVYDRHSYAAEKADALNRLAHLVDTIITRPADNVVALPSRR